MPRSTVSIRSQCGSYTGIDFYGDVALGSETFNRITLDSFSINGHDGGAVNVRARNVTLRNSVGGSMPAITGAGSLEIRAEQIEFGAGSKALSGFSDVKIAAGGDITGTGAGDLRVAANLTLESARLSGALKSDQAIAAVAEAKVVDGAIVKSG